MQTVMTRLEDTKQFHWKIRLQALRWLQEQAQTEEGQRVFSDNNGAASGGAQVQGSGNDREEESGSSPSKDTTLGALAGVLETQLRDLRSAVVR